MRADAQRNRQRLLDAAIELMLAVGGEPPLDAVARRAGVGIATLYRRFPDSRSLLNAVAEHVLDHNIQAAETALTEAPDGHAALRQYMHAAVEHGVGVLNLIHPLLDHPDWTAQRSRMSTLLEAIFERGKRDGGLRHHAQVTDIVFANIRFSRPVAIGLSHSDERTLAHRHLDIYIDGLGTPSDRFPSRTE